MLTLADYCCVVRGASILLQTLCAMVELMVDNFASAGQIDLREDNVESLLSTASILQLSEVVEACCGFLMKQLHPSNCIGIRSFADVQGCTDLLKVAHNYTMVGGAVLYETENYINRSCLFLCCEGNHIL